MVLKSMTVRNLRTAWFWVGIVAGLFGLSQTAIAQIVLDDSRLTNSYSPLINFAPLIETCSNPCVIDGNSSRGGHSFSSFQEFHINDDSSSQIDVNFPNLMLSIESRIPTPQEATYLLQQLLQTCPTGGDIVTELGEFVMTGRGGIPPNPTDILGGEVVLSRLALLPEESGEQRMAMSESITPKSSTLPALPPIPFSPPIEAQGWVIARYLSRCYLATR
jgi:hypothetical protein